MIDEKRIKRFIEGAKEAFKEVDDPTFTFPINILSAYELATSIEELLKEQEEEKRRWLQCIADNQLANSPTYGKDDNVAYWHKRGIWDGLQMAWEILTEEK